VRNFSATSWQEQVTCIMYRNVAGMLSKRSKFTSITYFVGNNKYW